MTVEVVHRSPNLILQLGPQLQSWEIAIVCPIYDSRPGFETGCVESMIGGDPNDLGSLIDHGVASEISRAASRQHLGGVRMTLETEK